jgi:hypothetical protein
MKDDLKTFFAPYEIQSTESYDFHTTIYGYDT